MGGSFPAIVGSGVDGGKQTFIQRGRTELRQVHPRHRRHHPGMADRAALLDWIGLPEAREALQAATAEPRAITALRNAFTAGQAPPAGSDAQTAALAAVDALPAMLAMHRMRGIDPGISRATAMDLALWMREHHRRHGAWGLSEGGWLRHHLSGRLLRLGRLQFMPATCRLERAHPGVPLAGGDPVLEVHIPAGEPLTREACLDSFDRARGIFAAEAWTGWFCRSWLLAPELAAVLPPGANILAFQSLFTVLPGEMDDRQTIERVFGSWPLDPGRAPRATSLQRAVLAHYAAGGRIDGAAGFRAR